MSLRSAAALATGLSDQIGANVGYIGERSGYGRELFRAVNKAVLTDGAVHRSTLPVPPDDQELRILTHMAVRTCAARRLWLQHRIVYDIDPDLWAEMGTMGDAEVIPAGLMRALPHPDPFVVLPQRTLLPFPSDDRFMQRVDGLFVTGRTTVGGHDVCVSTHSPHANGNLMLLICRTLVPRDTLVASRDPDVMMMEVSLPFGAGDTTVGGLLSDIKHEMQVDPSNLKAVTMTSDREGREQLLRAAIGALVYVCATNADLSPDRTIKSDAVARRLTGGGGARKPKPVKAVEVGFHVGAALRAHRARLDAEDAERAAGGAVRTVRPHVRRAHFHTFRHGPGRSLAKVKWLPPIPINVDKPGDGKPTAHRIALK